MTRDTPTVTPEPEAAVLESERLRRIEAAAKASVKAWEGMRAEMRRHGIWDEGDEAIYQSPVQTELRDSLQ